MLAILCRVLSVRHITATSIIRRATVTNLYHTTAVKRQNDNKSQQNYQTQQTTSQQQNIKPQINVRELTPADSGYSPSTVTENVSNRNSIDYVTNDEIDEWMYRDRMTPERARAEQLPVGRDPLYLTPQYKYMEYGIYLFWILLYTGVWYIAFQMNLKNLTSTDVHTFVRMHADSILREQLTAKDINPPTTGKKIAGLVLPDDCVKMDYQGAWKPAPQELIEKREQDIAAGKQVSSI